MKSLAGEACLYTRAPEITRKSSYTAIPFSQLSASVMRCSVSVSALPSHNQITLNRCPGESIWWGDMKVSLHLALHSAALRVTCTSHLLNPNTPHQYHDCQTKPRPADIDFSSIPLGWGIMCGVILPTPKNKFISNTWHLLHSSTTTTASPRSEYYCSRWKPR